MTTLTSKLSNGKVSRVSLDLRAIEVNRPSAFDLFSIFDYDLSLLIPITTQQKYQKHQYVRSNFFCNTNRKFEQQILYCTVREENKTLGDSYF